MAEDFRAKITAELDTAEAENKLNAFLNKKNKLKIDVEVNQDSAKKLSSSIEKGIRQTKLDTSSLTEQLAGSFNISDKNVLSRMKKQMDTMVSSLGKTWNGSDFDFKNASGFYSGLNNLSDTVTKNAKIVQGKTGIYDDFFNYFKDKKIYVSDELKKAMGGDAYKELLQNNIGKIVRDSTKGVSIDSIWGEMTSLFPEHFSTDMMNQVDQITHAFDLMKQARADMTQSFSVSDLKGADFTAMTDSIAEQVLAAGTQLKDALQTNLMSATEAAKTMIDLDVEVNTEKIASDIRSAVQSAGTEAGEALNVDLKINDEQLISELRSAVGQLGTGEEPVKVNLQVDRESLQSDLNLALNELELPVHFKVDAEEIESQLRAAVESITDIQIDLRVNTDPVTDATAQAANTGNIQAEVPVTAPQTDTSGLTQLQQALGSVNTAGQRSQSIFSSLGSSFREAFSAYSLANLMQDGLYKITDAGKEALSTVKEFNDLETDLAMATGESRSYASDLTQSYNALGQELGSITSDVAKSADSWLRQGRSMSETNQLIKDSMVLSKDAQMDSENASEVLTATLNGFQMNADQAGHINDVLTSIDLESASDAGGIGQALTKVASQANNAGVSLEKTAAMIATIKDVTQDSDDSIGTGLKSILSRMNQIKAGKFVDSETGESLNDVEKVLNKVGISMRDVNGQFKESEPIIDEVAGKWSTFDGNTKKAVATAMAGTYQYNKLIAMFDNWDKVQSLTETALNADGTAQKKFEDNYLTSLEAKTNALKASLENLATSTVSSDLYSGFLDGSKSLVDFANNINLVQSAIAGLGAAGGVYAIQQIVAAFRELSNLGNALNLSRAVNIPDDSFQRLLTLTQGLSESQTRLVLSSTALTDAQRAAILTNQGMSSAEAQASVAAMGLSTAEGAAAASTFSLSGALSGLWATLMANPLILVAAGVTAAVSAFSAYQHSVEEAVSSAKQAGTEWQENNTSLQDNIERITELRTALSSGTLTEQEAASAKSELLSIQESLTDSYHNQVAGIDLINGSLEEQIALLDKVSQKEASQFQNENKKGIEEAEKKVEKKRHTYLGQFLDNGSKESEAIKKSINDLKKEYGDEVFTIEPEMDGITMDVHFKADSVTAKQALNDFMDDAKSIEKQYGESDTLSVMLDNASGGLSEANEILGKYGDLYEQAQEAKLVAEEQTFKADGKDQTALKWLNDYTKAVKNYNDALTEGDSDKITQAAGEFETVDTAVQSLLKNSDMFQFADQFSEVRDQLNDTAIAANQFSDALSGKDTSKFGKEIKKNADSLKELGLTDTDFKYAFETEGVQEGEDQINALVDAAVECGLISDTSSSEVAKLVNMLTQLGVISSSAAINYKIVSDNPDRQIAEKDYTERIKTNNRQILALQKLRQEKAEYYDTHFSSWNNEEAQKYLDSITKIDEQILNLGSSTEELKNKIMELRWKPFNDFQDELDSVINEYQTMQKLLGDEDSFYNDDGSLTQNGLTNVLLLQESIDATKDKLANYRVALDKLEEQYQNGCYSAEEYKEKTEELLKGIQDASSSLAEYRQQMLSVYETQVKTENDLLQKNIDKRLEALDAKEKYYEFDKTIRKKSKDINALKASISALEGTSNAAAKARLEKLKAELADAEEDMQDTVHNHETEMKKTGYENLQKDAENALDNTLDALKKNTSFQEAVINNMLSNVKTNYDSTYKHLGEVMDQYGMKVSQTFDQMIIKAADFNTAAVNATKAWEGIYKMDTSKVPGASNGQGGTNGSADKVLDDTLKKNDTSDGAGNVTPGTMTGKNYTLKLSDTDIYLTYSHIKKQLKATWSPSKPEHSDIEWKSSDESIAKVSSDGTVRGVSSGVDKNNLMKRDESKTRKCIITAIGGGGLAKATCTVHVMPDSHYEKIKDYANKAGIKDTSGNNLRDAMEYAYKNGANHSNQSYTAVEGFKKAYLKDWTNSLPNRPDGATDVPTGVSPLIGYFNAKGKKVGPKEMQQLADILQINTPGVKNYDSWESTLKNKILKAYKSYGFSKGGVVRKGIPASILDMIGADALIPRGDSMLIGANPGETVLTKEFTDQLKPTVATLNEFNARMAKPITEPSAAVQNQTTEVANEYYFTFNNPVIKSEEDVRKLIEKAMDDRTKRNKRDWKKVI